MEKYWLKNGVPFPYSQYSVFLEYNWWTLMQGNQEQEKRYAMSATGRGHNLGVVGGPQQLASPTERAAVLGRTTVYLQ